MTKKNKYVAPQIDMVILNAMGVVTASDGFDNYEDDPFDL